MIINALAIWRKVHFINVRKVNCIDPYFPGIDDDLCTLVEACAKSENEFRCAECIEFYCLDVNKGICIENDKIENETYIIYFACEYTNKEGNKCEKCLDVKKVIALI